MKILVVDDDEIALAVSQKILQNDGHEVILAGDGEEAMEILRQNEIRIVISDWNMPNMDGIELLQRLRSAASISYTYVIIVTARNSKEDMLAGLSTGADDFITKPFEPAELLVRVRNAERILALETTSVTLFSLAKLAESKDTDTGNHLERMREYARLLAEQIITRAAERGHENRGMYSRGVDSQGVVSRGFLTPRFPDLIFQTSPLHDIGKVGIPDFVLLKPGSLSDLEWGIMKRHTEIGGETLDAALKMYPGAEFLRSARDIAWSHHERWDGTGYPRGLKEEEIPLSARIVSVADVYDALTMRRVYKAALPHDVARGIILSGSGTQFDPDIIQAFLAKEAQFIKIRETYSDH